MSKQRHRRRSQGETTPETTPQTGSGVAHFSVSEVVQFSMSVDKHHLAAGENAIADLGDHSELKGSRHGFRHGDRVAVERLLNVDSTLRLAGTARSGMGVDVCMAMQAPCLVNVIALPVIAEQQL